MKNIFEESTHVGDYHRAWVARAYSGREEVRRDSDLVYAYTKAHHDQSTRTLLIDHTAESYGISPDGGWPQPRRSFHTVASREEALRLTIAAADAWIAKVTAAIPPAPPEDDEAVLAAWRAGQASERPEPEIEVF